MGTVYPNEGLVDIIAAAIQGLVSNGYFLTFDVDLAPVGSPANLWTYGSVSGGFANGYFTATSSNMDGDNTIRIIDIIDNPRGVFANSGLAQAAPIYFTNVSGVPQTIYAWYSFNPNDIIDNTYTYLWQISVIQPAPITIPAGGTYIVFPLFGDLSQNTN